VPGIGRKKAERLALELGDRFGDLALTGLGYQPAQADDAVREALTAGATDDVAALIKRALQILMRGKAGRG